MKIIGLDVGEKRIGVAKVDTSVKIATPVETIEVANGTEFQRLASLARIHDTNFFVLGLPRNNQGAETAQSAYVKNFAKELKSHIPSAKIKFQDESLTSVMAEDRLKSKKSYRKKGKLFKKGEVDSEAAAIILQDFIESFPSSSSHSSPSHPSSVSPQTSSTPSKNALQNTANTPDNTPTSDQNQPPKKGPKMKKFMTILTFIIVILGVGAFLSYAWYTGSLSAPAPECAKEESEPSCAPITFTIDKGDNLDIVASALQELGLIKNAFAYKINAHLSGEANHYQAGDYTLQKSMTSQEISTKIARGEIDSNVFSFTMTPGTNTFELKKLLLDAGYTQSDIDSAFAKNYSNPILSSRPAGDTSLEGYLYPDTYEFYKDSSVSDVIEAMLTRMSEIVKENNLEQAFSAHGLTLHEGITLASIVEEESIASDFADVAAVFYNRMANGMALGSDVTAKYAADILDPTRSIYTDNSLVIEIDSPYNTRKYTGLTPGPISSPSLEALKAVASPAQNDYLFFLTGDDGLMYYSSTESGHNQNAALHCQELCNISL